MPVAHEVVDQLGSASRPIPMMNTFMLFGIFAQGREEGSLKFNGTPDREVPSHGQNRGEACPTQHHVSCCNTVTYEQFHHFEKRSSSSQSGRQDLNSATMPPPYLPKEGVS